MKSVVVFSSAAEADLAYYRTFEQRIIVDAIKQHLVADADSESKRRKKMIGHPLAPWELRAGDFRVFYEIDDEARVKIISVGHKEHNTLLIRGRRLES
jgi:mRNA-degrading endonuclease RelE of RelBE toxin-antitoxin system